MEIELQQKFRADLKERYLRFAFEQMALYTHWGRKYEAMEAQAKDLAAKIGKAIASIAEIEGTPDSKARVKSLRADVATWRSMAERSRKPADELGKRLVKYQQEAAEALEQAESFDAFVLRTPKEIAESRATGKCAEESCQNMVPKGRARCMHHEQEA